jgi:hypothetical protein
MKSKQTKPLYLALTLLALAGLAFSLIAPLCSGAKQKWKWYESKEWGFRIKYPADWELYESRGWRSFYVQNYPVGEIFPKNFFFFRISLCPSSEKSLEEIVKDVVNFAKEFAKEQNVTFKILKYENVTLGGAPAIHVEWIGKSKHGESRQSYYLTRHNKRDYTIEFSFHSPANWEKYVPLMKEMIKSFEFIEVKNEK